MVHDFSTEKREILKTNKIALVLEGQAEKVEVMEMAKIQKLERIDDIKYDIEQELEWLLRNEPMKTVDKEIIVLRSNEFEGDDFYFLYDPVENNNNPCILTISKKYEITDDTTLEVPITINDGDEVRFLLKYEYKIENNEILYKDFEFSFLKEEDIAFSELINKLEITNADIDTLYSFFNNEEEATKALKSICALDIINIEKVFRFIRFDSNKEKDLFELSLRQNQDSNFVLSKDNYYTPKVDGLEKYRGHYFEDVLALVTQHARTGESLVNLGAEEVEPNWNYDELIKLESDSEVITGLIEEYKASTTSEDEFRRPYLLDFDGDGAIEIIFRGNGMTYYNPLYILELGEDGKAIEYYEYAAFYYPMLYKYNNKYFLKTDFNIYFEGYQKYISIYAKNKDTLLDINEVYEAVEYKVVYRDKNFDHNVPNYVIDNYVQNIEAFKESETFPTEVYTNSQSEITEEEVREFFDGKAVVFGEDFLTLGEHSYTAEKLNLLDMNNDGILDLVLQSVTNPATYNLSGIDIMLLGFIDGKTKEFVDISMEDSYPEVKNIDIIEESGENYFLILYGEEYEKELRLVKFEGTKTVVLERVFAVAIEKINIEKPKTFGL